MGGILGGGSNREAERAAAAAEREAQRREAEARQLRERDAAERRARAAAGSRTTPGTTGLLTNTGGAAGLDNLLERR